MSDLGPMSRPSDLDSDLSQGTVSAKDESKLNMGLRAHEHQLRQQGLVAKAALCAVGILFVVAIAMGAYLVHRLATGDAEKIHWHASILVAAFVVPPTLILVALLKATYAAKDKDEGAAPAMAFLKEAVGVVKQVWTPKSAH